MSAPCNILLITDDQHRADCLGVAGHPVVQTPHLDQLAYEGTRFSAAYSDCPICIPARCSLISGQLASTYGKPYFFRGEPFPIDVGSTMMSCLTRAGYQTQAVGKMHFYPERACYGFENMVLDIDYVDWMDKNTRYKGLMLGRGMGLNEIWPVRSAVPAHLTNTAWTVDESIRFLERRDPTRPFFLWTSFFKPHPPFDPPEPYDTMYDDVDIPGAAIGDWDDPKTCPYPLRAHREAGKFDRVDERMVRKVRSQYYGLITEIDHQLGRLFGALNRYGLLDNTLIVFTSDHGEMLGDHRDFGKASLYDASARVPLIVRWPKHLAEEHRVSVVDKPVGLIDILPTLVELGGGTAPDRIDGVSLLGTLDDGASWRPWIPLEVNGQFGLTDGRWKYLWFRWGGREQLFDLKADPYETRDLAGTQEYQHEVGKWRRALVRWLAERGRDETDGEQLLATDRPYPPARGVLARNPHGWYHNYPWTRAVKE